MSETILFVDDEKQTLKYFKKIFEDEYDVLTADTVDSAWSIIEKRNGGIAILLTDQRMPEGSGVDLLKQTRQKYPKIIRMLTTAYANLDSAIQSVNEGAIYQYIVKPWEVPKLKIYFKQAIKLYNLQNERDMLLDTKLHMVQRLIIHDRVLNVAAFLMGQSQFINPLKGLSKFISQLPNDVQECAMEKKKKTGMKIWQNRGSVVPEKSKNILDMLFLLKEKICNIENGGKYEKVILHDMFLSITDDLDGDRKRRISIDQGLKNCVINVDIDKARLCFNTLMNILFSVCSAKDSVLYISAAERADNDEMGKKVGIEMSFSGQCWDRKLLTCLYTLLWQNEDIDISIQTMLVYLIIAHMGGTFTREEEVVGVKVALPSEPAPQLTADDDKICVDVLTQRFDSWDAAV